MSNKKASDTIKGAYDQLDITREKILALENENKRLRKYIAKQRQLFAMFNPWVEFAPEPPREDSCKPRVGDMYVIQLDTHMTSKKGDLWGVKGFNSLVFDESGLEKLKRVEVMGMEHTKEKADWEDLPF